MAYLTGSYTDVNDAVALLSAWAVTNGWTENMNTLEGGTNRRVHISKTIDGLACYFSFKTMLTQTPFTGYSTVYGIAMQGATGYASGSAWNDQPGRTTQDYVGSTSGGGCVDKIKATGGTYYFFATATTLSCMFETDSDHLDWRGVTVGNVGSTIFYAASGGSSSTFLTGTRDLRSGYLGYVPASVPSVGANSASCFDGTGWFELDGTVATRTMYPVVITSAGFLTQDRRGSLAASIVAWSPDAFRGNAQLAPSQLTVTKDILNEYWPVGEVEGVKFVNMKNLTNGQEITYGSDTYKLFRVYNPGYTGVALLK